MSQDYANIVFDQYFRPTDELEDYLGTIETKAMPALERTITTGVMDPDARVHIAYLLAIQACRYPEHFSRRLDLARYLAISLRDAAAASDLTTANAALSSSGLLPGASISPEEFKILRTLSEADLSAGVDYLLSLKGYEQDLNPGLIFSGAVTVAEHLLALDWRLLTSSSPAFLLCDHPVPVQIGYGFGVGLSASLGVRLSKPIAPAHEQAIVAHLGTSVEIDSINEEVRSRTAEWICGPGDMGA